MPLYGNEVTLDTEQTLTATKTITQADQSKQVLVLRKSNDVTASDIVRYTTYDGAVILGRVDYEGSVYGKNTNATYQISAGNIRNNGDIGGAVNASSWATSVSVLSGRTFAGATADAIRVFNDTGATAVFRVSPDGTSIIGARGVAQQTIKATATTASSTTTLVNVTGLSASMLASTDYAVEGLLIFQSAATTAGIRIALTGPASPTSVFLVTETQTTASAFTTATQTAYLGGTATTTVDTANTNRAVRFKGVVRNGTTAGTLQVQVASSTTTAVTVQVGSYMTIG